MKRFAEVTEYEMIDGEIIDSDHYVAMVTDINAIYTKVTDDDGNIEETTSNYMAELTKKDGTFKIIPMIQYNLPSFRFLDTSDEDLELFESYEKLLEFNEFDEESLQ